MGQLTEQTQFTDRQFVYSYWQVNGERNPSDVYKDFRSVVLQMLGMHDQGSEGPAVPANVALAASVEKIGGSMPYKAPAKGFPPVIWVIGECLMERRTAVQQTENELAMSAGDRMLADRYWKTTYIPGVQLKSGPLTKP